MIRNSTDAIITAIRLTHANMHSIVDAYRDGMRAEQEPNWIAVNAAIRERFGPVFLAGVLRRALNREETR